MADASIVKTNQFESNPEEEVLFTSLRASTWKEFHGQEQVKESLQIAIGAAKKVDLIQQLQREKANKVQHVNNRFFDEKNKYNYMHYDRNYRWIR